MDGLGALVSVVALLAAFGTGTFVPSCQRRPNCSTALMRAAITFAAVLTLAAALAARPRYAPRPMDTGWRRGPGRAKNHQPARSPGAETGGPGRRRPSPMLHLVSDMGPMVSNE